MFWVGSCVWGVILWALYGLLSHGGKCLHIKLDLKSDYTFVFNDYKSDYRGENALTTSQVVVTRVYRGRRASFFAVRQRSLAAEVALGGATPWFFFRRPFEGRSKNDEIYFRPRRVTDPRRTDSRPSRQCSIRATFAKREERQDVWQREAHCQKRRPPKAPNGIRSGRKTRY
jgi:hypothetical protein